MMDHQSDQLATSRGPRDIIGKERDTAGPRNPGPRDTTGDSVMSHPGTTGTQWKAVIMTASTAVTDRRGITGPALIGSVFLLTTVVGLAFQTAAVFIDDDPYRAQGPVDSIKGIALFGGISLIVALAIALPLRQDPAKARIGAVVLGALALITLPFFWCGAPAIFGAGAAWLAGLVKDTSPQTGVARGFGIIGLVIAALLVVATPVLYIVSFISGTN